MTTRVLLFACLPLAALAQSTATIDIDTTHTTPLNANFSGFNDEVPFPPEYSDYRLNNIAATLSPGWVRYPSGLFSQAFNWQTGEMAPAWVEQFNDPSINSAVYNLLNESIAWVGGKGGGLFADAANRANFWNAKLIVAVNGYTDTPQSAGQMAAFAKANHIPVAVWELSNEPYLYKKFFASGLDYATQMKAYADAIHGADPSATVAIFFTDAGGNSFSTSAPWNASVLSYKTPYWDAVTWHVYPPQSSEPFAQQMADSNANLMNGTAAYVNGYIAKVNPPGTKFLISEFLPQSDGTGQGTSIVDGTLYGAIYGAEFVMRMSAVPSMIYCGPHALTGTRGVNAVNSHYNDVTAAYNAGSTIDTLTLNFGFYMTTQQMGAGVLNSVLHNATEVPATTVTGGGTVAATGLGQIPALYAQAYLSSAGQQSVVITNKSATAQQVTVRVNGTAAAGPLTAQYISGTDPTAANTATNQNAVVVKTASTGNPISVPPYSVMSMTLNSPPVVTAVSNASYAAGPVAAQEIVSLFGTGLASQSMSAQPPGTSLAGVCVQVTDSAGNAELAPLLYVSPTLINLLVPAGLANGPGKLAVIQGSTTTQTGTITIANSAPGLYSTNLDGAGVAAAVALRYSAANQITQETVFTCDPSMPRSCLGVPLSLGASTDTLYVELYGTGIRGAGNVQAYVAGQPVPTAYAAQGSFAGLDQVNIQVPRGLAGTGTARVYVIADGVSSNAVSLTLE